MGDGTSGAMGGGSSAAMDTNVEQLNVSGPDSANVGEHGSLNSFADIQPARSLDDICPRATGSAASGSATGAKKTVAGHGEKNPTRMLFDHQVERRRRSIGFQNLGILPSASMK